MISSEEFHQKLQAGQIHEALALVLRSASELDITTTISEPSEGERATNGKYLRTTINLLAGEVRNEVGKDLLGDPTGYSKLQQLHVERTIASHQILRGYLEQIQSILAVLPAAPAAPTAPTPPVEQIPALKIPVGNHRFNSDALAAKLTQAMATLTNRARNGQIKSTIPTNLTIVDGALTKLDREIDRPEASDRDADSQNAVSAYDLAPVATETIADDDLDLTIDNEDEVWEEWVDDEDFRSESLIPQPPATLPTTILDVEDLPRPRHLHPIEVKPIVPRTTFASVDPAVQWDKFEPEYIGIVTNLPPHPGHNSDRDPIDR
jgi:hypothetical protein